MIVFLCAGTVAKHLRISKTDQLGARSSSRMHAHDADFGSQMRISSSLPPAFTASSFSTRTHKLLQLTRDEHGFVRVPGDCFHIPTVSGQADVLDGALKVPNADRLQIPRACFLSE